MKKLLNVRKYPTYARQLYWNLAVPVWARIAGIELCASVKFYGWPIVAIVPGSRIRLGQSVTICSDSRYTELGVNHPVVLRTLRPDAMLSVGDGTGMSGTTICAAQQVDIGRNCLLGANSIIVDTDFHPIEPCARIDPFDGRAAISAPVFIGDNVFLGANAIVLKGVKIGNNSVVGAGAVVSKDIPANCVAAGNPARVLRSFV